MVELVDPDVRFHRSFLAGMAEFASEGRTGDDSMIGSRLARFGSSWNSPEGFAAYVGYELADRSADTQRPSGHVPCTNLWWVEGVEYLGRIAIRHELTSHLREVGGHIGYDVRPRAAARGTPPRCCRRPCRSPLPSASPPCSSRATPTTSPPVA